MSTPPGMTATNSGVTPEAGFTYSNLFLFYSRSELKDANGAVTATGQNSVIMDMNSFIWVGNNKIQALGGAIYSCVATLPIANNSLTSDADGPISGGGGFADSYYQPVILGWSAEHADLRVHYGFLAPLKDLTPPRITTWVRATGLTLSFEMYEFHTVQKGTDIHPGETLDLDYSVTQVFPLSKDLRLQIGLVGYEQLQTTDKTGPTITPAEGAAQVPGQFSWFRFQHVSAGSQSELGVQVFSRVLKQGDVSGKLCADFGGRVFLKVKGPY